MSSSQFPIAKCSREQLKAGRFIKVKKDHSPSDTTSGRYILSNSKQKLCSEALILSLLE